MGGHPINRIRQAPKPVPGQIISDDPFRSEVPQGKKPVDRYEASQKVMHGPLNGELGKLISFLETTFKYRFTSEEMVGFRDSPSTPQVCQPKEFSSWLDVNFCTSREEVREWAAVLKKRNADQVIAFIKEFIAAFPDSFRLPDIHPIQNAFNKVFPDRKSMAASLQNLVLFSDHADMIPFIKRYTEILQEPVSLDQLAVYLDQKKKSENDKNFWVSLERRGKLQRFIVKVFPKTELMDVRLRVKEIAEGDPKQYEKFVEFLNRYYEKFGAPDTVQIMDRTTSKDKIVKRELKNRLQDGPTGSLFWFFLLAQEPNSIDFMKKFYSENPFLPPSVYSNTYYHAYLYQKYVGSLDRLKNLMDKGEKAERENLDGHCKNCSTHLDPYPQLNMFFYPPEPIYTEKGFSDFTEKLLAMGFYPDIGLLWGAWRGLSKGPIYLKTLTSRIVPTPTSLKKEDFPLFMNLSGLEVLYRLFMEIPLDKREEYYEKLSRYRNGLVTQGLSYEWCWNSLMEDIFKKNVLTDVLDNAAELPKFAQIMKEKYQLSSGEIKNILFSFSQYLFALMETEDFFTHFQNLKTAAPKDSLGTIFAQMLQAENPLKYYVPHPVIAGLTSEVAALLPKFPAEQRAKLDEIFKAYRVDAALVSAADKYILLQNIDTAAGQFLKPEAVTLYKKMAPFLDTADPSNLFTMGYDQETKIDKENIFPIHYFATLAGDSKKVEQLFTFLEGISQHASPVRLNPREAIKIVQAYEAMVEKKDVEAFWSWFGETHSYLQLIYGEDHPLPLLYLLTLTGEDRESLQNLFKTLAESSTFQWELKNAFEEPLAIYLSLARNPDFSILFGALTRISFPIGSLYDFDFRFFMEKKQTGEEQRIALLKEPFQTSAKLCSSFAFQHMLAKLKSKYDVNTKNLAQSFYGKTHRPELAPFLMVLNELTLIEQEDWKTKHSEEDETYSATVVAFRGGKHPLLGREGYQFRVSDYSFLDREFSEYMKEAFLQSLMNGGRVALEGWVKQKLNRLEPEARHLDPVMDVKLSEGAPVGIIQTLSLVDLLKVYALLRVFENPGFRDQMGVALDHDYFDVLDSELGGTLRWQPKGVSMQLVPPSKRGNDEAYFRDTKGMVASRRGEIGGMHFHSVKFGEGEAGTENYAAPSSADLNMSKKFLTDEVVFTRLPNGRFNIDFYSYDGTEQGSALVLDLGNWSYAGR
ncbi:MAG: hypothetical protein Q7T03_01335 [Deltaproteobacteria bacterium]|nr:hypothetical protein [Deltaproteobacteria bacterium]